MSQLQTVELSEATSRLPEISEMGASAINIGPHAVFICALGFESRCLSIPETLAAAGVSCGEAFYVEYDTNRAENEVNLPRLKDALEKMAGRHVESVPGDDAAFGRILKGHVERLADHGARIIVDISVMANRVVMACLKVLLESRASVTVLYSEAAQYYPTLKEYKEDKRGWKDAEDGGLEQGVGEVVISAEFPGEHPEPLPDCVVVFPTFRAERARAIIATVDPALLLKPGEKVVWMVGRPHLESNEWRIAALRELNDIPATALSYEVSTFDYRDSMVSLYKLYDKMGGNYKISIAPLGSKMQSLGVALFCFVRPDVRVVVARPKSYNAKHFSDGCAQTWQIDFGPMSDIRALLESVGTLRITGDREG